MEKTTSAPDETDHQARYLEVLSEAIALAESNRVPYLLAGSLASETWGRPGRLGDVDLLVDPRPVKGLLQEFGRAGYEIEETFPTWLYKATKSGVTVDLIFELAGPIYLEPQMLERGRRTTVRGVDAMVMGPEDFVLSQAMALKEDTAVYWRNAMAVIEQQELDWEYIVEMSRRGPRMVLALLWLARVDGLKVPADTIRRIFDSIFDSPAAG